jgi:UDP-N-acetylmuramoyl-L-alanyl-D-glutamate--2,6-diaminopimelate ligase
VLFRQCETAVLNLDDEAGRYYAQTVSCAKFTYSENKDAADVVAKNIRLFPDYVEFEAVSVGEIARIHLPIPGGFSIYNALGVIACGLTMGIRLREISDALRGAKGVKGRLEVVSVPAPYTVIIDYAHSPDALENVLTTVRDFTKGRLICVFGCGGDRDRTKRPIMGRIALELSDLAIVTSDNPRTEEPGAIIAHILEGMTGLDTPPGVEPDRRKAIRLALNAAGAGDVVLLAGKGHETYQEIGGIYHHLDEREEIAAYFSGIQR